MSIYFVNLTIGLHALYICMSNFMLIRCYYSIYKVIFYALWLQKFENLKFKHLFDDIVIDFRLSENFLSMKDIRRKYNSMMNLSKFTFNKKILSEVIVIGYN